MEFKPTVIGGCLEIQPRIFSDNRGAFVKTFHRDLFRQHGLQCDFAEQFYSTSHQGVLRGLHFQLPPADHAKLVTCVAGEVLDAVVDLRVGSPTYGKYALIELGATKANMVYIPSGMAHGFLTLSASATLLYNTTSVHSPAHDSGIRWDSAKIPWKIESPVVSPRDAAFVGLSDFNSPFRF